MSRPASTEMSAGVDLSAEPKATAVAIVSWNGNRAEVVDLHVDAADDLVLHYLHLPGGPVGVDCPLGWPVDFVSFVADHRDNVLETVRRTPGWRRELVNRRTDLFVRARTGLTPLSVAADKIGHVALRMAALLSEVGTHVELDRDGSGDIVEVYPAAALHVWGMPSRGYKGPGKRRELGRLVDQLESKAPWLDLGAHGLLCRTSDDALDAVLCALVARAARCGQTIAPTDPLDVSCAPREGWIHLPQGSLPAQPWQPTSAKSDSGS